MILKKQINYLTLILEGRASVTQCVAVTTQFGSMRDPPQKGKPDEYLTITCHGQLFTAAS